MEYLSTDISNGLSYVLLLITFGLIGFDCRKDIRQLVSARNMFLITILAWYLLEAWNVPPEIQRYSQAEYNQGLIGVLVCIFGFVAGYESTRGGIFDGSFRRMAGIDRPKLMWGVFVAAVIIGFAPLLIVSKGNVMLILDDAFRSRGRWGGAFQRGRFGGAKDALLELQLFLRAALPLAAAILMHPKQPGSRRLVA
ncbi:MAG TPA: hypothetical protein DDW52_27700, partial [Planctomycetaceae bacterium]|nr:hypothetical protein [Planctomycetaceae bacterium]